MLDSNALYGVSLTAATSKQKLSIQAIYLMAKKKSDKSALSGRASDFAKNIWLAGLGAYGEAYDEMTNQQKSLKELPQLFKELVAKGSGFESTSDSSAKKTATKKVSEASGVLNSESIDQRIRRMRETLQLSWPQQSNNQIQRLEEKIDLLSAEINELKSLIKTSAKKAPKKRRTTGSKVKAATKKSQQPLKRKAIKKSVKKK